MKISFLESAWADYLYWQNQDKKTLRRSSLDYGVPRLN